MVNLMSQTQAEIADESNEGIARDSLSAKIYQRLRSDLMTGRYSPGERLNIRRLADTYETSATPVREAMMQLVREGGHELRPGHQLRVPVLSISRYVDIREVRGPLERLATERAAALITETGLAKLEALNDAFFQAEDEDRRKEALALNLEFHFTIYRASGNQVLVNTLENLWLLSGPFINNQYPNASQEHSVNHPHLLIIDALRRRAPGEAGEMVVQDMRVGSHLILDKLKSDPNYGGRTKIRSANL